MLNVLEDPRTATHLNFGDGQLSLELPAGMSARRITARLQALGICCSPGEKLSEQLVPASCGSIVGVGSSAAAAELFARASGGSSRIVDDLEELARMPRASSVLAFVPSRDLTHENCRRLAEATSRDEAPLGLLPLEDSVESWFFCVARQLALKARPARHVGLALFDGVTEGKDLTEMASEFLQRVRAGVDVTLFAGHGNGCDFQLGNRILCEQADGLRSRSATAIGCLPCQAGGNCGRETTGAVEVVGASALRTRALVLLSCWGILPADGRVQWPHSFASALLRGPHVQAVIGSSKIETVGAGVADACAEALRDGMSLGELVQELNGGCGDAPTFLCLGEPDLTLLTRHPSPITSRHEIRDEQPSAVALTAIAEQARFVQFVARKHAGAEPVARRLRAIASGEQRADETVGREVCDAVMAAFSAHGLIWPEEAWPTQFRSAPGRHFCGNRLTVAERRAAGHEPREIWCCDRCGLVADVPAGMRLPVIERQDRAAVVVRYDPQRPPRWLSGGVLPWGTEQLPPAAAQFHPHGLAARTFAVEPERLGRGLRTFAAVATVGGSFVIAAGPIQ
ncbi:MAG TPA: hypothetical protein VEQ59_17625 [Polyangiaceae bacterium]|nr:hypothetical protein [Polyangiaceae bacterium]